MENRDNVKEKEEKRNYKKRRKGVFFLFVGWLKERKKKTETKSDRSGE